MTLMHDAIYVVTLTPARGEQLKQAIDLRGFDEILCMPYENAVSLIKANPPALVILDTEGDKARLTALMAEIPPSVRSVVLADDFDEELFVQCHDHGARDYLVKPVPDAYLVSRVLRCLEERRTERLDSQKDRILVEMGVLSLRTGVFSTSYLLRMLKKEAESVSPYAADPLSLIIVQLEGDAGLLPEELQNVLASDVAGVIKECSRGFDAVGEYFLDKFAVILPQTGIRGARALAKRLLRRLDGYQFKGLDGSLNLRVRIGLAEYAGCRHYEDLLNRAMADLQAGGVNAGR